MSLLLPSKDYFFLGGKWYHHSKIDNSNDFRFKLALDRSQVKITSNSSVFGKFKDAFIANRESGWKSIATMRGVFDFVSQWLNSHLGLLFWGSRESFLNDLLVTLTSTIIFHPLQVNYFFLR
jgi:hypothetical protein